MTRHEGFDVRLAPEVVRAIRELTRQSGKAVDDVRRIYAAQDALRRTGTRAAGVKKLRSLETWEIRAGRYRLFFCRLPGTRVIAVGAVVVKSSRRIRMARLRQIERRVQAWRRELEEDR